MTDDRLAQVHAARMGWSGATDGTDFDQFLVDTVLAVFGPQLQADALTEVSDDLEVSHVVEGVTDPAADVTVVRTQADALDPPDPAPTPPPADDDSPDEQ